MGYGASAKRVPARGGGQLIDADVYKIGMIGQTERSFEYFKKFVRLTVCRKYL